MKSLQPVTQMTSLHVTSNSSQMFRGHSYDLVWGLRFICLPKGEADVLSDILCKDVCLACMGGQPKLS